MLYVIINHSIHRAGSQLQHNGFASRYCSETPRNGSLDEFCGAKALAFEDLAKYSAVALQLDLTGQP